MTERRRTQDRASDRARPGAGPTPGRAPEDDAVLELQELAGNRAVSELLVGQAGTSPAPSAGLRVRDLLRGMRPAPAAPVQRVTIDEKEAGTGDAKAAYEGKTAYGEKAAWEEKLPYDEKAYDDVKAAYADGGATSDVKAAYADKDVHADKAPYGEKAGYGEKAAGPAGGRPMLAVGSAGPSVARLQALLVQAGFGVTPDGMFGPRTRAAVVTFQAGRGLAADGIVGPMTWGALETPGGIGSSAGAGGMAAPGEMEVGGPAPGMEKSGAPSSGEATLPDEAELKKEGSTSWK